LILSYPSKGFLIYMLLKGGQGIEEEREEAVARTVMVIIF